MPPTDINDWSLLRHYIERRSEAAFEALVRNHMGMVYSAARRQTGDEDLAEEATQAVFVLLAQKAPSLRRGVIVAGWLYRTACLTARRALRDQTRRRIKDREVAEMKPTDSDDEVWIRLMPHLDAALTKLGDADRTAIVLRFLEQRNFRQVATALSVSEDAAKKRVSRALEKLRHLFIRRGVAFGLVAIAAALSAKASAIPPAGLLNASVQAGISDGTAAGPGVGTLVAGVVRDAVISRLKWGAVLTGLLVTIFGIAHWMELKSAAADALAARASIPSHPRSEPSPPSRDITNVPTLRLRVVADEINLPLVNVTVHAEFISNPKAVAVKFLTDDNGVARIVLPTGSIDGMSFWVSVPGRTPMTIAWDKVNLAILVPQYTLRLPLGRLVAGTVVDEAGKPIAGAKVHFQGEGIGWDSREFVDYEGPTSMSESDRPPLPTTDASGRWSADFVSPHAKSLYGYVEHPGFGTTEFGHVQPPDPIEPSTDLVFVLKPEDPVAGAVRDAAGEPIQSASVDLRSQLGMPPRWMRTDPTGRFAFSQIGDGQYFLSARAEGFSPLEELPVLPGKAANLDIVLKPRPVSGHAVIRGRVVREDGKPISGVSLGLAPGQPDLEGIAWGMPTDAQGRFAWTAAPNHSVKLTVGGVGSDWEQQQVALAPDGKEAVITMKPKAKIRLHGTLVDKSTGISIPEFKVLWALGEENGYAVNTRVLTDGRDGKFAADLLPEWVPNYDPPGTRTRLDFQAPGYVKKVVALNAGINDIDLAIELEPATDFTGTVLRPDGSPAPGAKVFFRGEHFRFNVGAEYSVGLPEYPFAVETRTGADGAFHIPKIDGVEWLEAVHPEGWANVPLNGHSAVAILLQPWARIDGVVRSSQGVQPGVEVRAKAEGDGLEQMSFDFVVRTDGEGRFGFSQLPGGRAVVFVPPAQDVPGANRAEQSIQLGPGQAAEITLLMQSR